MHPAKTSLDHLVSDLLKMHRDIKSKGLSHPEIDKKLETGRLLHRKFTRLSAFQNLVDVDSHTPERVETVRPVCHKRTAQGAARAPISQPLHVPKKRTRPAQASQPACPLGPLHRTSAPGPPSRLVQIPEQPIQAYRQPFGSLRCKSLWTTSLD